MNEWITSASHKILKNLIHKLVMLGKNDSTELTTKIEFDALKAPDTIDNYSK